MAAALHAIGEAAGAIWAYLDNHGPTTLARLKTGTKLSEALMYQAIGWLAREDKIAIEAKKSSQTIALK